MDPLVLAPAVLGAPLAWASWLGVGAASGLWPTRWRRSALLAAVGLCAAAVGTAGMAPALLGCVAVWAVSLARLGAFAGALAHGRGLRVAAGAAAVAVVVAADLGAQRLTGAAGSVLDAIAPSVALGESFDGSVSWGTLATLVVPGVLGWAGAGVLGARSSGQSLANAWATALLAPCVVLLLGVASEPLPALWDGTASKTANLHPSTVAALHRLDRPILFTTLHQRPGAIGARAAGRRFERLSDGLIRASLLPLSVERLDPQQTRDYLSERDLRLDQIGPHALVIRALDRDAVIPLQSTRDLQPSLAAALSGLDGEEPRGPVVVVGDPWPGLDLGRPARRHDADREPLPLGTAAVVALPSEAGLSPAGLAAIDAHVMGGGGLVVLYGEPLPDGPRRGVPLTNPWGFHAHGAGPSGFAAAAGDWGVAGFDGLAVPPDAPAITGPDGLGEPVAQAGEAAVAMAMIGSLPSGFPDGPRAQSVGAVRAFLTSAALARENPSLAARALDWVLDEAEVAPLRDDWRARPARSLPVLLALCLLGPGLVLSGGLGGREA